MCARVSPDLGMQSRSPVEELPASSPSILRPNRSGAISAASFDDYLVSLTGLSLKVLIWLVELSHTSTKCVNPLLIAPTFYAIKDVAVALKYKNGVELRNVRNEYLRNY